MANDLEQKAREVLRTVELLGLDFVRGTQAHNPHLQYGLEQGLYSQADVDNAQKKYKESHKKR